MSHFRSIFRQISANNSYQVSNYGPRNDAYISPNVIPGLRTWLDVSDSAYVTSSGGYIDTITNKGSAGGTFKPTTSATRPFLSATSVNAKNTAGFDGVDDVLTSSIAAYSVFGAGDPAIVGSNQVSAFTIGIVFKPRRVNASAGTPISTNILFEEGNGSIAMNLGTVGAVTNRLWFDYGSVTTTDWVTSSAGEMVAGTTVCAIVTMFTKSYDLYINGNYKNTVARSFQPTATAQYAAVGSSPRQGTPSQIDLCEFVVYSGSLSPKEISSLNYYFMDRWGIT